ncbi:MAG: hypothetical protein EXR72_10830 [Myxococcales bacterium]|nr:hypothetical protein [Myxococcales bacterium]
MPEDPRRFLAIASLGRRAIEAPSELAVLCDAGADLIRINFSHTTASEAARVTEWVRTNRPSVRLMQDLQGAKLRVGKLAREIRVAAGEVVVFVSESRFESLPDAKHKNAIVPVSAPFPFTRLAGTRLIRMKDGTMIFRVESNLALDQEAIQCRTELGGVIRAEKGMNAPGVERMDIGLPPKDLRDLEAAYALRPDVVCVSFVTSERELREAREVIDRGPADWRPELWAKVECAEAMLHLEAICGACDAVLIGQGDLSGELGADPAQGAALEIAERVRACGKPCSVGTGLLESMRRGTVPTGGEIANLQRFTQRGVSGFLLTAETTIGADPGGALRALRLCLEYTPPASDGEGAQAEPTPAVRRPRAKRPLRG